MATTGKLTHNSRYGEVVTPEGVIVTLSQDAYPDGTNEEPYYRASGTDADGNDYRVRWETTAEWDEQQTAYRNGTLTEDDVEIAEEDACDWDDYTVTRG